MKAFGAFNSDNRAQEMRRRSENLQRIFIQSDLNCSNSALELHFNILTLDIVCNKEISLDSSQAVCNHAAGEGNDLSVIGRYICIIETT